MSKFVLLTGEDEYENYILESVLNDPYVIGRKLFKTSLQKKIFRIHNAWPLNKKIELPFKFIWYSSVLDEKKIDKRERVYFILYESFHLSFSKKYLTYLKRKYENSKFCFVFHNTVNLYNINKLDKVRKYYDEVITFYADDAENHGFTKLDIFPYQLPVEMTKKGEESDVFFIGSDKGRLPKLINIYEKLKEEGLKGLFYIVGVPEEKQIYKDEIRYNQRLSYNEVLEKVKGTKCVLEVLQDNEMYSSIRAIEAFQYKKKLLTTNRRIIQEPFYNENIIRILSDDITIDREFIMNISKDEEFPDPYYWSFTSFKKHFEDKYARV